MRLAALGAAALIGVLLFSWLASATGTAQRERVPSQEVRSERFGFRVEVPTQSKPVRSSEDPTGHYSASFAPQSSYEVFAFPVSPMQRVEETLEGCEGATPLLSPGVIDGHVATMARCVQMRDGSSYHIVAMVARIAMTDYALVAGGRRSEPAAARQFFRSFKLIQPRRLP